MPGIGGSNFMAAEAPLSRPVVGIARLRLHAANLGGGDVEIRVAGQQAMHAIETEENVAREAVELLVQVRDFEFGLQVHVILDVGMDAVLGGLAVLAEQDEDGEKDGLERDGEREEAEGIRVELRNAR